MVRYHRVELIFLLDMNCKIISVESRKGGVGKTTIALYIAKKLRQKGYVTILLDCDITGTPINKATAASDVWKKVVKSVQQEGHDVNLLDFFSTNYLNERKSIPTMFKDVDFKENVVHIVGSEIYKPDGGLIIDPRSLMDELHSYWFIQMLQEIKTFIESKVEDGKAAIIVDNSPGYVGIGKGIHEWMSSIGPEHAKYILVSSIDPQDVNSVVCSASEISNLVGSKLKVAKAVSILQDNAAQIIDIAKELEDDKVSQFFYSLIDRSTDYPTNKEIDYPLETYVKLIFNKVPEALAEKGLGYAFNDVIDEQNRTFAQKLIPLNDSGYPRDVIVYEDYLSQQYAASFVIRHNEQIEFTVHDELTKQINLLIGATCKSLQTDNIVQLAFKWSKEHRKLLEILVRDCYTGLSRTVQSLYNPKFSLDEISDVIQKGDPVFLTRKSINVKNIQSVDEIITHQHEILDSFITQKGLVKFTNLERTLHSLMDYTFKLCKGKDKDIQKFNYAVVGILWQLLIAYQYKHYNEEDYVGFLKNSRYEVNATQLNWNNYFSKDASIAISAQVTIETDIANKSYTSIFAKFYKAITTASIHLMFLDRDYHLVLEALNYVVNKSCIRVLPGSVKSYLRDVAVTHTREYDEAEMSKLFADALEYESIEKESKSILKEWKL